MYTPKEPYKPHSIVNLDTAKVLDLKIYINERKIGEQIATMHANELDFGQNDLPWRLA